MGQGPYPHPICHILSQPQPQTGGIKGSKGGQGKLPGSRCHPIPPHQTEWPPAQLGCSRSMLRGAIDTSWETWRMGLALGLWSQEHKKHENMRLGNTLQH